MPSSGEYPLPQDQADKIRWRGKLSAVEFCFGFAVIDGALLVTTYWFPVDCFVRDTYIRLRQTFAR